MTKPLAETAESNYRIFVGEVKGSFNMSIETHLQTLRNKHADLETQIHQEQTRPLPDPVTIRSLKRAKLEIKDEMRRLRS